MTLDTCPRCGQPHPRCHAHNRQGRPCMRSPAAYQHVCNRHGAKSPQALAEAERRRQEAAATHAMTTLGRPINTTPTEALLEEVRWTAGHVAWLRERVQDLEQGDLVWGTTKTKDGGDDQGTTQEAKPSVWYVLYSRERQHLVTVCAAALKAGIEERRVRLAEQQGALVAEVIRRILAALNLTPEQLELVPTVVPRELRAIEAAGAA